jgi:hypothetical protein
MSDGVDGESFAFGQPRIISLSLSVQELRTKTGHNLEIQYIVKQGQVEIDPGAYVHNFDTCLLINRNVVNALNQVIQTHGKQKISIMVECKEFKKGIRQLEWFVSCCSFRR